MMAAMFKQDRAPAAPDPMSGITQALTLIQTVKGLMPEPAVDTGDSTANLLLEGIRTVSGAFANAKGAAPAMLPPPIPQAALPNPIAQPEQAGAFNPGAQQPIQQPQPQGEDMGLMQRMMVGLAINDAKKGAPVESDAAIFFEKADDDLLNIVIDGEDATGKDWFTILCEINPDAKDYRPWFDAFRGKVLEYDKASNEPEPEPQPSGNIAP